MHFNGTRNILLIFQAGDMDLFSIPYNNPEGWGVFTTFGRLTFTSSCSVENFCLYHLATAIPDWYAPSGQMTFIQRQINVDATSSRYIEVNATLYKRNDVAATLIWRCINVMCLLGSNDLFQWKRREMDIDNMHTSQFRVHSSHIIIYNSYFVVYSSQSYFMPLSSLFTLHDARFKLSSSYITAYSDAFEWYFYMWYLRAMT